MKKNFIRTRLILGLILIIFVSIGVYKIFNREFKNVKLVSTQELNLKRIKELTENSLSSAGYPDEKSAQAARKEICQLTARTAAEQNRAITAIRNFLDKPTVEVKYQCSDAFYDATNNKLVPARSETYTVGLNTLLVNPQTNHVVSANIQEFETVAKVLSAKEAEDLAKSFITNHSLALGNINIGQYTLETGQKVTNYFFTWKGAKQIVKLDPPSVTCSKDIAKDTKGIYYQADGTPCYKTYEDMRQLIIQIAFNSHGQLLNYANSFEGEVGREVSF
ncbi:MAG: hypothetical protein WCV93_03115 [Candidatus Shapirobacteria bacterium]|jgi:hypothetical protein